MDSVGRQRLVEEAAVVVTDTGRHHTGVCIDARSGTGFCAEHAAIAAMVTAGEYRIAAVVAVWRGQDQRLHVLPPCGRCRELITQIDPANTEADVVLGRDLSRPLSELLPHHDRPSPEPETGGSISG